MFITCAVVYLVMEHGRLGRRGEDERGLTGGEDEAVGSEGAGGGSSC